MGIYCGSERRDELNSSNQLPNCTNRETPASDRFVLACYQRNTFCYNGDMISSLCPGTFTIKL